jgi:HSP20 family protein
MMAETAMTKPSTNDTKPARREPFDFFDTIHEEMGRLWGQPWPWTLLRRPTAMSTAWAPKLDVFEKNGNLVVKAELPGVDKEDISVTMDSGDLEIRGERKSEQEVKEENYYRCERSYGSLYRRVPLPFEAQADAITAEFKDGVLEVRIPKPAEAKPEAQKITIA